MFKMACRAESRIITNTRALFFGRVLISATLALVLATATSAGAVLAAEATEAQMGEPVEPPLELTDDLTREEIRDLMSRLSDDQVRELLLQQLDRNAAARDSAEQEDAVDEVYEEAQDLKAGLAAALRAATTLPQVPRLVWAGITEGGTASTGALLFALALIFGLGWGVEWLYRRATKASFRHKEDTEKPSPFTRLGVLILRAIIESIGIAIFALTAFGVSILVTPGGETSAVLSVTLITGVVAVRVVLVIARLIFVPEVSWLRVLPFSDDAARALYDKTMILTVIMVTYQLAASLLEELAIDYYAVALVIFAGSFLFMVVLSAIVWNARRPVAEFFGAVTDEDSQSRTLLQGLAANWHVLVIAYVIGIWIIAMGSLLSGAGRATTPGLASLGLVVALVLADLVLREFLHAYFAKDAGHDERATESGVSTDGAIPQDTHATRRDKPGYEQVVLRNLRIVLGIVFAVGHARQGLGNRDRCTGHAHRRRRAGGGAGGYRSGRGAGLCGVEYRQDGDAATRCAR